MAQPNTFLMDSVAPNEQALATQQPIQWTLGRIYDFEPQVPVSTNKAAWYKSTDGGIHWSTPDLANANVAHGFSDWYWDGVSNTVTMAIIAASFGVQSPILQHFNLDTETYSANFGAAGAPSETFTGPIYVAVMSNGKIMIVYATPTTPGNSRCKFAVFDPGSNTWTTGTTDLATNIGGNFSQWDTVIPDPANNLIHVYYVDSANNFFYRKVQSDATLGAITSFPGAWHLHVGNLNNGRGFNTGFLDTAGAGTLVTPVFTRDPVTSIFSLAVVTGTPSAAPVFSISAAIDTASSSVPGQDIGQAVAFKNSVTGLYQVLYFMGDGVNLYNVVKLATFSAGVWSTMFLYDASLDPNAGKNTGNQQWLNAISGTNDASGNFVFQVATWLTLAGQGFQNTSMLTTLVGAGVVGKVPVINITGLGLSGAGVGGGGGILYKLPDPKVCKESRQMRRQFQNDFDLPNMPAYPGYKKPAFTRNGR